MLNLVVFKREVRDKLKLKCLIVFVNILGSLSAEKGQMVAIFSSFFFGIVCSIHKFLFKSEI